MSNRSSNTPSNNRGTACSGISLFWFGIYLLVAYAIYRILLARCSSVLAFVAAVAVFFLLAGFFPQAYVLLLNSIDRVFPMRPTCANGKCHTRDYWPVGETPNGETVFRCDCGLQYVDSTPRFMRLLADGTTTPYRIRTWCGRWQTDVPQH
jgi:hypothetical protein